MYTKSKAIDNIFIRAAASSFDLFFYIMKSLGKKNIIFILITIYLIAQICIFIYYSSFLFVFLVFFFQFLINLKMIKLKIGIEPLT